MAGDNAYVKKLREMAVSGELTAQNSLAALYATGESVEKDYEKAIFWYSEADKQGDMNAKYNLALMELFGEGVEPNANNAIKKLLEAAKGENADANLFLANIFINGSYEQSQSDEKAIKYFIKSAVCGSEKAVRELGKFLESSSSRKNLGIKLMKNFVFG
ncbi:MAG: tetratricopeptide repeat protein [Pseudohongiellaceae bacterium]